MPKSVEGILSVIDSQFSRKHHMGMLLFLAQCAVPHGQLEKCKTVPEVYRAIKQKYSDDRNAVTLLKHMIRVTGYKKQAELQRLDAFCTRGLNLNKIAPFLAFYELLLLLAKKLYKNGNFESFLDYINEDKLNKSKHDISSPLDLLQSMLHKGTIDPNNHNTLMNKLIVPLKNAGMNEEAQFMEQSILPLESRNENSIGIAVYFNSDGGFQQQMVSGVCIQQVGEDTIETLIDTEKRPLLMPSSSGYTCSTILKALSKWKKSCIATILSLLIALLFVSIICGIFAVFPVLHQTQPIYGNLVYQSFYISAFKNLFYGHIEATVHVEYRADLNSYNLTICQTDCSWKTQIKYFGVSNGTCPANRPRKTCFAQLDKSMQDYPGVDPQVFSIYLLRGSKITFRVTNSNSGFEHIQLCMTTDKDTCNQVFQNGNSAFCHQLMTFSKSNNYTQTFIAHDDSYYCAVWLLESRSHWINYSTSAAIQIIDMSEFYSPHLCESFQKNPNINFTLRDQPKVESICIVVEENSKTYFDNFTIVSRAYNRLNNRISISACVVSGLLAVPLSLLLIFVVYCLY